MLNDDTEQIDLEDSNEAFTWDEAVQRAKYLHYSAEFNQLAMGKLASKVQTAYGKESLRAFANETGISYETIKRYRSVWRAWEKEPVRPTTYSIARALARIPDKARIVRRLSEESGDNDFISEDAAIQAAKKWREERSAGKYRDFPLHKVVSLICRRAGAIASDDSELAKAIDDFLSYTQTENEYRYKVVNALDDAIGRLQALQQRMVGNSEPKSKPEPDPDPDPDPKPEPDPDPDETTRMMQPPFRKGEADE
jgi:hypothetical protein